MILRETDPSSLPEGPIVLLAALALGLLALLLALCRLGLDSFSHGKLLKSIPEGPARERLETRLRTLDRTRVGLFLLSVGTEALFVLASFAVCLRLVRGDTALAIALTAGAGAIYLVAFCRLLPRVIVTRGFEPVVRFILPVFHAVGIVMLPITAPLLGLRRGLYRALGIDEKDRELAFNDEIIATVAEGEREGVVAEEEAEMIENVVWFRDVDVAEVMTPRTDMNWVEASKSVFDALTVAAQYGHSRLPIGEKDADHVIGVFYVRDVIDKLSENGDLKRIPVRDVARTPYFVPESKRVGALLSEFRENQVHIAIVLDEYGGTAGLVTLEDVLEEIVGEIVDEYDKPIGEPELKVLDPNHAEVDARARIWDVNEALEIELPESEDFDTVGGFVFSTLGRMPGVGETIHHEEVEIQVLDADQRRIKRLGVRVLSREGARREA